MSYDDRETRESAFVCAVETLLYYHHHGTSNLAREEKADVEVFLSDVQDLLDSSEFKYNPVTGKETILEPQ